MTAEEQRIIGQLGAKMDGLQTQLSQQRAETRDDFQRLYERFEKLASEGCAKGQAQDRDIAELKARPERLISVGAGAASILAAVIAWLHK